MSDDLVINNGVTIPAAELTYAASRSSGPGGQHVNTSDTRIQLRWSPGESRALTNAQRARVLRALATRLTEGGEIVLASDAHRSQRRNRDEVRQRLAQLLREALVPPKPRRKTRPTAASKRKRVDEKKKRGQIKRGRGKVAGED